MERVCEAVRNLVNGTSVRRDTSEGLNVRIEGYEIDILVQGFPGKSVCHGGLGWSTVALVRGHGHVVLIDAGSFNMRGLIARQLERHD